MSFSFLDPKEIWLAALKDALVALRSARNLQAENVFWGKARALAEVGYSLGWITYDELKRIQTLIDSASLHSARRESHA